jgi:pSer/pThr/pTyr-binding forkhead associated (FHA) protein
MAALLTKNLGVVCPSCDFLNVVGAVRCMACGVPTEAGASSPSGVLSAPSGVASAPSGVVADPPGLRRSASPSSVQRPATGPTPAPIAPPKTASGVNKPPVSSGSALQQAPGPKFGLTVQAGPARGQRFRLGATGAQIGRNKGVILFPDDPFVSPLHATLTVREGKIFVRDENSTSGVYASVSGTETVANGSLFATGLRLFRFVGPIEPAAPWNRADVLVYGAPLANSQVHYLIEEVMLGDRPGRGLITPGPVFTIGQGKCDFSYPSDEGLAPRHCEIAPMPTGAMIRDLSGGLGTFVRLNGERALKVGERIRIGQQTLQVDQL